MNLIQVNKEVFLRSIRQKIASGLILLAVFSLNAKAQWVHITSRNGEIDTPNAGKQQTSCAVADFNNDGLNDFCISERTSAPGLVWYQRTESG